MSRSIHFQYQAENACVFHRVIQPARFCHGPYTARGLDIRVGEGLDEQADWVAVQGLPVPHIMVQAARLKRRGRRVLWSVDDDWLTVPESNPAKPNEEHLAAYDWIKSVADLILTSTPHLASTFADVADKVVCAPNLLDPDLFPGPRGVTIGPGGRIEGVAEVKLPVRVVWSGGITHRDDLAVVAGAVDRVLRDLGPQRVAFLFYGMAPPSRLLRDWLNRGVVHQPAVSFFHYNRVLAQMEPDVYLAPLADVPFSLSKSNLRVMEGFAFGVPVVASPVGEYRCVRPGQDGRLAGGEDEWASALHRLATDHEYRLAMGVAARRRFEREYSWANPACREPWVRVFDRVFAGE